MRMQYDVLQYFEHAKLHPQGISRKKREPMMMASLYANTRTIPIPVPSLRLSAVAAGWVGGWVVVNVSWVGGWVALNPPP